MVNLKSSRQLSESLRFRKRIHTSFGYNVPIVIEKVTRTNLAGLTWLIFVPQKFKVRRSGVVGYPLSSIKIVQGLTVKKNKGMVLSACQKVVKLSK